MAQHGIVMEYRIVKDGDPFYGQLVIYYETFDRYYREDEKVSYVTGISRDTVESENLTYSPHLPEKIYTLFYVPEKAETEMKCIICFTVHEYWKEVQTIKRRNKWTYMGRCGASIIHKWFDDPAYDISKPDDSEKEEATVYIEELKTKSKKMLNDLSDWDESTDEIE